MDRRLAYRLAAPFYDVPMAGVLRNARRASIRSLALAPGERLLIPGIGTGLDLPFLPRDLACSGLDLSREMLQRAEARRAEREMDQVQLLVGDAQRLPFPDGAFGGALLHLILAVAPDGRRVLAEVCRCVKPGGPISVVDKFLPPGIHRVPLWRRAAQALMSPFTDLNRRLGELCAGLPVRVEQDLPVMLGGMFRRILLRRVAE